MCLKSERLTLCPQSPPPHTQAPGKLQAASHSRAESLGLAPPIPHLISRPAARPAALQLLIISSLRPSPRPAQPVSPQAAEQA